MKHTILLLASMIMMLFAFAQKNSWKEMDDFHAVMSKTFHPAEEKNLAPLKEKATALVMAAKLWQSSPIPQGYKAKETKSTLKKLVKNCKTVEKAVNKGETDAELIEKITKAHDTFHTIVEKCRDGEHKH